MHIMQPLCTESSATTVCVPLGVESKRRAPKDTCGIGGSTVVPPTMWLSDGAVDLVKAVPQINMIICTVLRLTLIKSITI